MMPLEVRRYKVCRAIAIHLEAIGARDWAEVMSQFPDLSPATFWRCVKRVSGMTGADRHGLAHGPPPAAALPRPATYQPRPHRWTVNRQKTAARFREALDASHRAARRSSSPQIQTPTVDPPLTRRNQLALSTWPKISQLVPVYKAEILSQHRRGDSEHRSLLRVCEPLWDWRCADVGADDLERILEEIARDAPVHANRARAYFSAFCNWAIDRGYTNYNPTVDIARLFEEPRRERTLSLGEVAEIWRAADELGPPFGPAIQLLILTAARRGHVDSLRKSEIGQGEGGLNWTVTNHRRGGSRQFVIPLSPLAREVIDGAVRASPLQPNLVFTTTGWTPISGWSRAKRDLDAIITSRRTNDGSDGQVSMAPWRLDDLRRSFIQISLDRLHGELETLNRCLDLMTDVREWVGGMWFPFEDEIEPRRDALFAWAELVGEAVGHASRPTIR
jgi:integrase